jgi:phosphoglycerate dehydrogenase-like enzyme
VTPKFLISQVIYETHKERLDQVLTDYQVVNNERLEYLLLPSNGDRLPAEVLDTIIAAYFSSDIREQELVRPFFGSVRRAQNLRWLHVAHAGTDDPVFQELFDRGVHISNSSGSAAEPIALTAFAALLSLARDLPRFAIAQKEHRWAPRPVEDMPAELRGQTVMIYGFGAIAEQFARLAISVGMRVVGVRRSYPGASSAGLLNQWVTPDKFRNFLPEVDCLVITAPLTKETTGLVSASVMSELPRGARIINVARGLMLDEAALIQNLESGHIGGAYLDVTQEEPLPEESPLWDAPNLILTPHDSSQSLGNAGRADEYFLQECERWARNWPLLKAVTDR